jgi:hypothetical protein
MGQTRPVHVETLMGEGTLEEFIYQITVAGGKESRSLEEDTAIRATLENLPFLDPLPRHATIDESERPLSIPLLSPLEMVTPPPLHEGFLIVDQSGMEHASDVDDLDIEDDTPDTVLSVVPSTHMDDPPIPSKGQPIPPEDPPSAAKERERKRVRFM